MAIKSLADRIREKKQENVSPEEKEVEKRVVERITPEIKKRDNSALDQVLKQAPEMETEQSLSRTDNQTLSQTNKRTDSQTVGQTDTLPVGHSNRHSLKKIDDPFEGLSDKQKIILAYLANQENGVVSVKNMETDLSIPYGTIRGSIRVLNEKKFISKPIRYRNGKYQGIKYRVSKNTQTLSQTLTDRQTDSQTLFLYSSSSYLYNKTTTCETETILSNHPELGYWRQKGLTAKQINQWMKTVGSGLENIVQFLCYCRFEMVDLKLEESKPIENVFNWFFRIIEKTGGYPKPKGYKSQQEKQIEIERQITEQHEREAKEAEEIYRRKIKAKQDKQFWDMMNDPESDLYKRCFDSLNDFQKKRLMGKGFEMSMRSFFDKFIVEL